MMNKEVKFLKANQRELMSAKREFLSKSIVINYLYLYQILTEFDLFNNSNVVGSFLSIKSEIPTMSLNNIIEERRKTLCLPVMINDNNKGLIFKKYSIGDILKEVKYGVKEPNSRKSFLPDIIFVPCLAFDNNGYRLGYGGGFYDKTIHFLKSIKHNFVTIGYAYSAQKLDKVIIDSLDQRLNYILTEKYLYKFI